MSKTLNSKEKTENLVEQMFQSGAHYGYGKQRRHPSTTPYIYTTKNKTDIIDLEKTNAMVEGALEFIKKIASENKTVLFVGTKPEAKESVKNAAMSLNMPYVTERWIGGTLTNFGEIKKRIAELENYHKENLEGGLEKYTKKERVLMAKKMEKLARYYSGLIGLKKAPDAIFIIDPKKESIAQREAKDANVPTIALLNSDSNIKKTDYPMLGNDASIPSIAFFTRLVANTYKENSATIK